MIVYIIIYLYYNECEGGSPGETIQPAREVSRLPQLHSDEGQNYHIN